MIRMKIQFCMVPRNRARLRRRHESDCEVHDHTNSKSHPGSQRQELHGYQLSEDHTNSALKADAYGEVRKSIQIQEQGTPHAVRSAWKSNYLVHTNINNSRTTTTLQTTNTNPLKCKRPEANGWSTVSPRLGHTGAWSIECNTFRATDIYVSTSHIAEH